MTRKTGHNTGLAKVAVQFGASTFVVRRILVPILVIVLFATSCATYMTPIRVNNTLPTLTKSKFISQSQADVKVENNGCKYLVRNRTYVAPMGLSAIQDLKHAAIGIDEWVKIDGGNSYVLKNYKWITVDHNGSTQLHIEFNTLLCE
jgi:hypothetical protein